MNIIHVVKYIGLQSSIEVPIGFSTIRFEFKKSARSGSGRLYINHQLVGTVEIGKDFTLCYFC